MTGNSSNPEASNAIAVAKPSPAWVSYFSLFCRLVLGLVLIWAGWSKVFDMQTFMQDIANYRILPHEFLPLVAITLPAIELVAGVCLILGLFMEGALFIATVLFIVFLLAIESAILRGLDIKCGCFGTTDAEMVGINVLVRDFILFLFVIPPWLEKNRFLQLDRWLYGRGKS